MAEIIPQPIRKQLYMALAEIYLSQGDAWRLATEAGLSAATLTLGGSSANNWEEITRKAAAAGRLTTLIQIVQAEGITRAELAEALAAIQPDTTPPSPPPVDTLPEIDDVELRDFLVMFFTADDMADLMLVVTKALRQDGQIGEEERIEIDSFSSMSMPRKSIAREMIQYFEQRLWTDYLVRAVRDARKKAFQEKFGGAGG